MIWTLMAWVLVIAGMLVGARALLWDRAGWRGRAELRCRKCWYDLTGVGGEASAGSPVVCSECGREHRSRRAMRRTRRRWGWVVVGVVVLVGAYGVNAWPEMRARTRSVGWPGAVPTPVLILSMRWMPAEAGSLPDRHSSPGAAIPYRRRPWGERFGQQIMTRLYKPERTTRLDRWLFVRAARGEPPEVLTDPTAVRGEIYRYVFHALAQQGRLSYEDERWARSVHQLEIRHAEYAVQSEPSYARIRVRRLLESGRWRLRIYKTLYDIDRKMDWKTSAGFYGLRPVDVPSNGWWDGAACIADWQIWNRGGFMTGSPPTSFERHVSGAIYDGDPYVDIWWPAGEVEERVEFKIAQVTQDGVISEATSPDDRWVIGQPWFDSLTGANVIQEPEAFIAWLRSSVEVRFAHDEDVPFGEGLPERLMLSIRDHALRGRLAVPPFTFGGHVRVVIQTREGGRLDGPAAEHSHVVMEGDEAWWAVRDQRDDQGLRVFEGKWERVGIRPTRDFEYYQHQGVFTHGGPQIAFNDELIGGYMEVRFGGDPYRTWGGHRAATDLDAERLLTAPFRVPLDRSDAMRILRAVRSDMFRIGYKDLYTEDELAEIEQEHKSRTWTNREQLLPSQGLQEP